MFLLLAALPLAHPAKAEAATTLNALTLQGDGSWVGGWSSFALTPANSTQWGPWNKTQIQVIAPDHRVIAFFNPPVGQQFAAGKTYPTLRFRDATHAGLDVGADGRGCNQAPGTLTVLQAAYTDAGELTSLAVDYAQHCEGPSGGDTYGSFRLNSPVGYAALGRPTMVELPTTAVGYVSPEQKFTVQNIGSTATAIDAVASTTPEFSVSSDECTGTVLPVGAACQVGVVMAPTTEGELSGTVVLSTGDLPWGSMAVPLHGTADPYPPDFIGINPVRLLDTRTGLGGGSGPVAGGSVRALTLAGTHGIPADAAAAAMNVTVTGGTQSGFITVFPCGSPRPVASNLNYTSGQTIPNAVLSKIGSQGQVCFYASGTTHLVVDLNGYFPATTQFSAGTPSRAADTRNGTGVRAGTVKAGSTLVVPVAGKYGVPQDASAVSMNVTVTQPTSGGFVTAYPCDQARLNASNLNFVAGQTIPNAVLSAVSSQGTVCFFTSANTHLVVDVNGAFQADANYWPFAPERILDSRTDLNSPLRAGEVLQIPLADPHELTAVSLNVTVTQPGAPGFVTVYPCDQARPNASNLNFVAGQTIPNAVLTRVAEDGSICLYTSAPTEIIVDINGVFLPT